MSLCLIWKASINFYHFKELDKLIFFYFLKYNQLRKSIIFRKYFFNFIYIFFETIIQKPIPQLKVLSISLSEIFLLFNHLKIFIILIFERSIFKVRFSGTDLNKFSINPPPVICAAEFMRFFFVNFKISSVYIFVGLKISFLSLDDTWIFFNIDLTSENPFEWIH